MGREAFNLLSDADILNALDVATCKLHAKLWPKVLEQVPNADSSAFFDECKLALAKRHGLEELLVSEGAK